VRRLRLLPIGMAMLTLAALPAAAQTPPSAPANLSTIVAVGEGVVKRAPDQAWVTIAAESRAKTPAEVQKMNADAMSSVLQKLKGLGLPPETIQTTGYELRPEFDYTDNRQTLRGYVARNTVEVRVDDLPRLGQVLDIAVGAGATSVSGIRFDIKNRTEVEQLALQRAVADARAQANTVAQAAGLRIERVQRIEVHHAMDTPPPPRPMYAMRAEMAASGEPPIAPGEMEVKATVTMTVAVN
jgi:uncharacterized protein YggE